MDKNNSLLTSKFIVNIKKNADRLGAIIDNMLFVSSVSKNVNIVANVNLTEAIIDAIESIQEQAKSKKIKILCNFKTKCIVQAEKELLIQAFINILNNSIKYSPPSSTVTILINKSKEEACVEITDKGCGISEEHLRNIFEPFYRVDKTRNQKTGGTGLGLYITKTIINKLGGHICCESEPGFGTTFNICLSVK